MHTASGLRILAECRCAQVPRAQEPRDEMPLEGTEGARLVVYEQLPIGTQLKVVLGSRPIRVEHLQHAEGRQQVLDGGEVALNAERELEKEIGLQRRRQTIERC